MSTVDSSPLESVKRSLKDEFKERGTSQEGALGLKSFTFYF